MYFQLLSPDIIYQNSNFWTYNIMNKKLKKEELFGLNFLCFFKEGKFGYWIKTLLSYQKTEGFLNVLRNFNFS